jgi:hypothetical protein
MAKSSISLVSVQKPTAGTPALQRRNKFTASIEQRTKIRLFREARICESSSGWMDLGIFFEPIARRWSRKATTWPARLTISRAA